ncbi:outer membrane lipoprotein LolB [Chiayiivirga flava]|uniref:Outer-membrane lipoprotein LolB n=1 Tax=Chiayiivirga flava TaxID=659595 RepID=A0A7W8D976_9GAMM|nr:outer membrane lipoprotein LolB [Chiayiivirga flava]
MLLTACGTAPRREAGGADGNALARQAAREATLVADDAWSFSGRIAVSNAQDGGSGRIDWVQTGDTYRIELRAPVTRRSWRLSGEHGWARLEGLDGGPFEGDSAEALLADHAGWTIPLADLAAWVRGARAAGASDVEFAPDGRLSRLRQAGWVIDYRAWSDDAPLLPTKVFAQRGDERVRLLVDRWN